jgi:hypothetical protein
MVDRIKNEEMMSGDESKFDGEDKKALSNKMN